MAILSDHPQKPGNTRRQVLQVLADGKFHSGTTIGNDLQVSRAAVNKAVQQLIAEGHDVHCVSGRGYRIADPLEFLDPRNISAAIAARGHQQATLHILEQVDSTSRYLMQQLANGSGPAVCMAEQQTSGRGRRGRQWLSTPFRNLMLSAAHRLSLPPADLAGLSLAIGVVTVECLHSFGFHEVGLKWPNDVLYEGRKLGGVLVDLQGESEGPTTVVAGLGINLHIADADAGDIDQAWTDLRTIDQGRQFSRNALAAEMAVSMLTLLTGFADSGFDAYRERWQKLNVHAGKQVTLLQGEKRIQGRVEGVDQQGALLLRNSDGLACYHSGEVSLRSLT